jgi:molybdenum cofactor cytidylyltransferase
VIPAIVLAAGESRRMGRAKASLAFDADDTFLTRIVKTLRDEVEDVVVVVGHEADSVIESATRNGAPARFVVNPHYESGQLSSILAGLRAVDHPGVVGLLLTLVDVPLISPATVRAVLERHRTSGAPIVRPVHGSRHGHPVVIARQLFDALRRADPAIGIKPIVRDYASAAGDVEVNDEGAFVDIDTPEDYTRFFGRSEDRRW